jgi:DNA polymerase delta subunit 1
MSSLDVCGEMEVMLLEVDHEMRNGALVMRLFCVSRLGHSVVAYVHGFAPTFFVTLPQGWDRLQLQQLHLYLGEQLSKGAAAQARRDRVLSMDLDERRSLLGFAREPTRMLRIVCSSPDALKQCGRVLQETPIDSFSTGGRPTGPCETLPAGTRTFQVFETNVDAATQFLASLRLTGAGWLRLPAGRYQPCSFNTHQSLCQLEVDIQAADVAPLPATADGRSDTVAPLLIASVDIECVADAGVAGVMSRFPSADNPADAVIMIATTLQRHGETAPCFKHIVCLRSCAPVADTLVEVASTEADLLMIWKRFFVQVSLRLRACVPMLGVDPSCRVCQVDPDVLLGYNLLNFDLPYLLKRAEVLKLPDFACLGRFPKQRSVVKESTTTSRVFHYGCSRVLAVTLTPLFRHTAPSEWCPFPWPGACSSTCIV